VATVTSAQHAVAALDAARAWLHNYGHDLTAEQVNAAARAALEITAHLGEVLTRTGGGDHPVTEMCRAAARPWRNAMFAAAALRSNVATGSSNVGLADTALTAVAKWLAGRVQAQPSTGPVDKRREAAATRPAEIPLGGSPYASPTVPSSSVTASPKSGTAATCWSLTACPVHAAASFTSPSGYRPRSATPRIDS
jgi:hypothetical protein